MGVILLYRGVNGRGAFSVIVQPVVELMDHFTALDWAVGSTGSRVFILVASYSPVIPSPDPDYKQRNYFTTSDPGQCQVQYLSSGDKQG